jgi:hypothetical protein
MTRRRLTAIAAAALLFACAPSRQADAQPNPPPGGHMALVEQIVRVAFPDLELKALGVTLSPYPANAPWMTPPEVSLLILEPGEQPPTIASYRPGGRRPFLRARARFTYGRFEMITFDGRYVNEDKGVRAGRELASPGLSLNDTTVWLKQAGALYPPDNALGLEAAVEQSPILSLFAITKLHRPEFVWPAADGSDLPPKWIVRAEGQDVDLALTCFGLFFEPFDGRLEAILAAAPDQIDPESRTCVPPR